jgi:hypothetical protein
MPSCAGNKCLACSSSGGGYCLSCQPKYFLNSFQSGICSIACPYYAPWALQTANNTRDGMGGTCIQSCLEIGWVRLKTREGLLQCTQSACPLNYFWQNSTKFCMPCPLGCPVCLNAFQCPTTLANFAPVSVSMKVLTTLQIVQANSWQLRFLNATSMALEVGLFRLSILQTYAGSAIVVVQIAPDLVNNQTAARPIDLANALAAIASSPNSTLVTMFGVDPGFTAQVMSANKCYDGSFMYVA